MMHRVLYTTSLVLLAACASGPSSGEAQRDRELITADEIREVPVTSAWELVARLRPTWIRSRGPASMRSSAPDYPVVYVDDVHSGGPEALQRISSVAISEIRFISARDAATRFGLNHGAGAIMVRTRRRASPPTAPH